VVGRHVSQLLVLGVDSQHERDYCECGPDARREETGGAAASAGATASTTERAAATATVEGQAGASAKVSQVRSPVGTRERYMFKVSLSPMGADFWDSVVETLRARVDQEVVRSEEPQQRLTPRVIWVGGWKKKEGGPRFVAFSR
jgi:hypothetical protein